MISISDTPLAAKKKALLKSVLAHFKYFAKRSLSPVVEIP
jgi:hypothetical protein